MRLIHKILSIDDNIDEDLMHQEIVDPDFGQTRIKVSYDFDVSVLLLISLDI